MSIISERITRVIADHGETQKELAFAVGTTEASVSRWCRGLRTPKASDLAQIALHYRVSADYLLGLSDKPKKLSDEAIKAFRMADWEEEHHNNEQINAAEPKK